MDIIEQQVHSPQIQFGEVVGIIENHLFLIKYNAQLELTLMDMEQVIYLIEFLAQVENIEQLQD